SVPHEGFGVLRVLGERLLADLHGVVEARFVSREAREEIGAHDHVEAGGGLRSDGDGERQNPADDRGEESHDGSFRHQSRAWSGADVGKPDGRRESTDEGSNKPKGKRPKEKGKQKHFTLCPLPFVLFPLYFYCVEYAALRLPCSHSSIHPTMCWRR